MKQVHLLAQVEAEEVGLPLGLHEHQSPLLGVAPILVEDADELVLLLVLGSSVECLHYVSAGATNESNLTTIEDRIATPTFPKKLPASGGSC